MAEFENWMTIPRIVESDFGELLFRATQSKFLDTEAIAEVFAEALYGFGNGNCYFLASAIASVVDLSVLGFLRDTSDTPLVHAALYNPLSGDAMDILGRRPIGQLRDELQQIIPDLRLRILPSLHNEMDRDEIEILLEIAKGLPWMPIHRDPSLIDWAAWGKLICGYTNARRKSQPD